VYTMAFISDMDEGDLIFSEKIGSGRCSDVYRALNCKTNEYVAVKIINKGPLNNESSTSEFEIYSNTKLYHRDIIKCMGWFENGKNVYMLYEYAPDGDLFEFLIRSDDILKETEVKHIIKPIICAVTHIHAKKWIHRDIKPENILLFKGVQSKVGDLEFAVNTNELIPCERVGTLSYMAPEVLDCDENKQMMLKAKGVAGYGSEIDCWSIGVLTYECLLKIAPFVGNNFEEIHESIKNYDIHFGNISENARDFILRCLEPDPLKRIKARDMLCHEWFNELKYCLFC